MATSTKFTTPARKLVWLITGCSSGFGLALVRKVQAQGHLVVATSRNPSKTPELVQEVEQKGGKWVKLDVDDLQSGRIIDELEASGIHVDVLVNNAGSLLNAVLEQATEEETRRQMDTLYFGPLRLIRAALPYMRKRHFGILVNFSTGAALEGRESMGLYAGAKAGLDGMSKVLGKEVAPFNIRVLNVIPGTFDTGFDTSVVPCANELPDDYKGSPADKLMQALASHSFAPDGDHLKAMDVLYDVITGTGVGAGKEGERFLPLGRDLTPRLKLLEDEFKHLQEVFGAIANSVHRDDRA